MKPQWAVIKLSKKIFLLKESEYEAQGDIHCILNRFPKDIKCKFYR